MGFPRVEGRPLLHAEKRVDQIYLSAKEGEIGKRNGNILSLMQAQGLVEHDSGWPRARTVTDAGRDDCDVRMEESVAQWSTGSRLSSRRIRPTGTWGEQGLQ